MLNQIIKDIKNDIFDKKGKIKLNSFLYLLALPIAAFGIISYIFSAIHLYNNPDKVSIHNLFYPFLMFIALAMKIKYQSDKPIAFAQLIIFSILWIISLLIILAAFLKKTIY